MFLRNSSRICRKRPRERERERGRVIDWGFDFFFQLRLQIVGSTLEIHSKVMFARCLRNSFEYFDLVQIFDAVYHFVSMNIPIVECVGYIEGLSIGVWHVIRHKNSLNLVQKYDSLKFIISTLCWLQLKWMFRIELKFNRSKSLMIDP